MGKSHLRCFRKHKMYIFHNYYYYHLLDVLVFLQQSRELGRHRSRALA